MRVRAERVSSRPTEDAEAGGAAAAETAVRVSASPSGARAAAARREWKTGESKARGDRRSNGAGRDPGNRRAQRPSTWTVALRRLPAEKPGTVLPANCLCADR